MAQIFEVTWSEGTVTPGLISSLLRQYVTQGGLYGTVVVKEAAQQPLALDGGGLCACEEMSEHSVVAGVCVYCNRPRQ